MGTFNIRYKSLKSGQVNWSICTDFLNFFSDSMLYSQLLKLVEQHIIVPVPPPNSPPSPVTEWYIIFSPHLTILSQTIVPKIMQRQFCFPPSFVPLLPSELPTAATQQKTKQLKCEQVQPVSPLSTTSTDSLQGLYTYFQVHLTEELISGSLLWSLKWSQTLN